MATGVPRATNVTHELRPDVPEGHSRCSPSLSSSDSLASDVVPKPGVIKRLLWFIPGIITSLLYTLWDLPNPIRALVRGVWALFRWCFTRKPALSPTTAPPALNIPPILPPNIPPILRGSDSDAASQPADQVDEEGAASESIGDFPRQNPGQNNARLSMLSTASTLPALSTVSTLPARSSDTDSVAADSSAAADSAAGASSESSSSVEEDMAVESLTAVRERCANKLGYQISLERAVAQHVQGPANKNIRQTIRHTLHFTYGQRFECQLISHFMQGSTDPLLLNIVRTAAAHLASSKDEDAPGGGASS